MKTSRCRCCSQPTQGIGLRFDASVGFVCASCADDLSNAEHALAEAGIFGSVIDKPAAAVRKEDA